MESYSCKNPQNYLTLEMVQIEVDQDQIRFNISRMYGKLRTKHIPTTAMLLAYTKYIYIESLMYSKR